MAYKIVTLDYREDTGYPPPVVDVRVADDLRGLGKLLAARMGAATLIIDTDAREHYQIGANAELVPYSVQTWRGLCRRLIEHMFKGQ